MPLRITKDASSYHRSWSPAAPAAPAGSGATSSDVAGPKVHAMAELLWDTYRRVANT
ncbi:MAG TPA: hypothetical protein VKQ30_17050 [Ktedonobacterales bacterium]|nr:hypothetical protein [Ktedonobacterales bacterium]